MDTESLTPFTTIEAQTKVGKRVRVTGEYSTVPLGTTGTVIGVHSQHKGVLVIQWDLPPTMSGPVQGWFGKTKFEKYLVEIN
ncbi:MAG: hypothetical protein L0Y56_02960 [Nitrospira sp.]|nr:hypothetical protein [Nitrospira sp.]